MKIQSIIDTASHRNGTSGAPFHVVLFEDIGDEGSRKVGIVFDSSSHVAVLDVELLAEGISDRSLRVAGNAFKERLWHNQGGKVLAIGAQKGDEG